MNSGLPGVSPWSGLSYTRLVLVQYYLLLQNHARRKQYHPPPLTVVFMFTEFSDCIMITLQAGMRYNCILSCLLCGIWISESFFKPFQRSRNVELILSWERLLTGWLCKLHLFLLILWTSKIKGEPGHEFEIPDYPCRG